MPYQPPPRFPLSACRPSEQSPDATFRRQPPSYRLAARPPTCPSSERRPWQNGPLGPGPISGRRRCVVEAQMTPGGQHR